MGIEKNNQCDPLAWVKTDEDILDFAEKVSNGIADYDYDARVAASARYLLIACTALLRDWFPRKDFTLYGLITTFAMALKREKYDTRLNFANRKSPLDLMFLQIEQGMKYTQDAEGQWGWRKSKFVRNFDGARPGDAGGLHFGEDIASAFYARWRQSADPGILEQSIHSCIISVAELGLT